MEIKIPRLALVVLIGPSGSGKSTFARTHFRPTEILSSDLFRAMISDDENDQTVTVPAFEILHKVVEKRLEAGKLTVVDATHVQPEAREKLIQTAKQCHVLPIAIVFNLPEEVCLTHNEQRTDRTLPVHAIRRHIQQLRRSLRGLRQEGFRYVYKLSSLEEIQEATITRTPLWMDRLEESGPFDIIGDVHGCIDELQELLIQLGYTVEHQAGEWHITPPEGRKAIFLGDLVDRGPDSPAVLRLVMSMVRNGTALCVPGNHDMKLLRKLNGRNVQVRHGLEVTMAQLENESPEWIEEMRKFLDSLVSHYILDQGRLVVAHAGMKESLQGRTSSAVRDFALYGETTGEIDEFGLPVRYNWAEEYRGKATVVYGHTPIPEPVWRNRTVNIDTGCVFGGRLTALRYPENEFVSVPAHQEYVVSKRPFLLDQVTDGTNNEQVDDVLDLQEVLKLRIQTKFAAPIKIQTEQAMAALESISRFAIDPKWMIYLPPTMSPSETSTLPEYLEHPREAFTYYREQGVARVICEEKHMGSRAVVIVCRDQQVAKRRFGVDEESVGICYTRTGRRFFTERETEQALLERLCQAMEKAGFWDEFQTDWACFDCELMPWSAKAQELLKSQYAAVGNAASRALAKTVSALEQAQGRGAEVDHLLHKYREREANSQLFIEAYRRYCWRVEEISDLRLAPFHILATEGRVHHDRDHLWHMNTIAQICEQDPEVLLATRYRVVDVNDESQVEQGIHWWEEMTTRGGEGMVVKPINFIVQNEFGLVQPAIKCRGREYLRIIYGLDYTAEENLTRLRQRGLKRKRSLALREFALGIEALERFVDRQSLKRVHECCFGILALESEAIDPRL